ncbi:hypothetical protein [Actinoplanes sp. CA-252034]|uniref:hypothetical protein n=1 Tax=Actinoplanes sp. CA-252034 TaxID=3239906 RepID=UPI003D99CA53
MSTMQRPVLRLVGPDERAPRPRPRGDPVRWALAVVATLQILLGLGQAGGGHVSNESMAWNIALGAAFLSVARAGRCPPGLLAVLGAFVATLLLLSVGDLFSGRVDAGRLATHALLITGSGLVLALTRRR